MTKESWSDPLPLKDYLKSRKDTGIYIIGSARLRGVTPAPSNENNDYLLHNFPNDFKPEYVGISESAKSGIRARLSKHARGKGNKHVAQLITQRAELYFICIYGNEIIAAYEPLFTALKTNGQFECNVRLEHERNHRKRHEKIYELITGKKIITNIPWDFEGDGM